MDVLLDFRPLLNPYKIWIKPGIQSAINELLYVCVYIYMHRHTLMKPPTLNLEAILWEGR